MNTSTGLNLFLRVMAPEKLLLLLLLFLRPLAQSLRLKIKQLAYGWIWLSLRFECARKRDCICLLDGNENTLKEVNGFEWITRDSCCASANFLGNSMA